MSATELEKDILQWDVINWSTAIRYWDKKINWQQVETCLEIGGREGGLSLWLALKGKKVISSDFEKSKLNAEPLHKKYKLEGKIQYEDINALDIPYENHFDIIVFKSVVGGIARNFEDGKQIQQQVFDQIYKALKPGGKLLFAENLEASPLHKFFRKKFNNWVNWRYVTIHECKEFLKKFSLVDLRSTGVLGGFGRSEKQKNLLSKIDKIMLNNITPKNWKYIVYAIAEK
jgi:2-polyprenyl-3-methyl-5-hydroxy-6-metoxy-1,4-benzoquinol methylase